MVLLVFAELRDWQLLSEYLRRPHLRAVGECFSVHSSKQKLKREA